jgi:hypothetical protein
MNGSRHHISTLVALVLLASALVPLVVPGESADAMPGFARKYKMSCTTCHAPPPRLKPYGEEFAGRGFRLEDPSQEPPRATYDVGDPLLMLNREIPLGMRLEGFVSAKEDAPAESDVEWPWAWKIISGGPISPSISYYFYFLIERGDVEGLEDAYLQVNGPFGLPVDVMLGQFQVSDPMFKREVRLTRADYEVYRTRVGLSGIDLTYDRGVILGTEAPGEVEVVLQVINGNGIPGADEERNFDSDEYKNAALRLARGIDEIGESIRDVRLGVFGYFGRQAAVEEMETGARNETIYAGADLTAVLADAVQVNLQYLERRDDDPYFQGDDDLDDFEMRGGFAEVHVFPEGEDGRWVVTGLYNHVEIDPPDETMALEEVEVTSSLVQHRSASLTVNRLLARNVRLLVEGAYDLEIERARGTIGLSAGF